MLKSVIHYKLYMYTGNYNVYRAFLLSSQY